MNNSIVFTDDQGNTYTILQLCKKVLKAIDTINGTMLYKHLCIMTIDEQNYSVTIINNHSAPYTEFNQEFGHALRGNIIELTQTLSRTTNFLVTNCLGFDTAIVATGIKVTRTANSSPSMEAYEMTLTGVLEDHVTEYTVRMG